MTSFLLNDLHGSLGGKEISLNNNASVQISTHVSHRNRV